MEQIINVGQYAFHFKFYPDINYWIARFRYNEVELDIEIPLAELVEAEIIWAAVETWLKNLFIDNTIEVLLKTSFPLVTQMGLSASYRFLEEVKDWTMHFDGLMYYGSPKDSFNMADHRYSLCFSYYKFDEEKQVAADGDVYAFYRVDWTGLRITGVRRNG